MTLSVADERNLGQALGRGVRCRCPRCGEGKLFSRYLKVAPKCDVCGLDLSQHQADDAPPYLTITIVGHIMVGLAYAFMTNTEWPMWVHMTVWPVLSGIMCLALLPPVKGAVVAYQWAMKMHGFSDHGDEQHHG